ncbi:MAG: glucoamylase family protein [Desulfobulbus sp.]|nr:glucoamylase family protein [Desulfobulbus sp.]
MNIRITAIRHFVLSLRRYLVKKTPLVQYANGEPPLRSGLFSAEQMEHHGKALAMLHTLQHGRPQDRLLKRLADNESILRGVRVLLTEAVQANRRIAPAGEWLLDNFYLIEEQMQTAKRHLPKGYSRELPHLHNGQSAELPRVYDIALETIAHGDGLVDPESLSSFVSAYQTVTILTFGELWAIPIMLRLALVENLRRVAVRVAADRIHRNLANTWADQMIEVAEKDPKSLILVIADMARSKPNLVSAFVAECARRLQGQSLDLALPLTWIEQRLAESGQTIEQLVRAENQQQAADRVSISNTINSLRFLGAMDWRIFVETMSIVEQTLRQDPGDVYDKMDFATRDRYRHAVEAIAKKSTRSENEVALQAIQLACEIANSQDGNAPAAHVGFYLVDKGRTQLEQQVGVHQSTLSTLASISRRFPLALYCGGILLLTAIFAWVLTTRVHHAGMHGWMFGLFLLLSVLAGSHLAVALANWLVTLLATPRPLPRMDFSLGIPQEMRTLVVVPTMLTSEDSISTLIEALEVRFLANQDQHLHYGLLTDFRDALEETLPEDEPLLQLARQGIEGLNSKYRNSAGDTFFLFHRPRRWNPQERIWMGHERKRGKLADLNWLLRAGPNVDPKDRFSFIVGTIDVLATVKYVITLDTDTKLARDSAWQFIGALAHPLNRACYDPDKQRVVSGYGILQPRVAVSLSVANRSLYARLCGSDSGIDPYTRAVSDVYQDLFGEGSFIGKGIYEVDTFEQALDGRFPDNRILSHDLLEGCYARSGLLSDVQLYEEYPSHYSEDVSRRHRWIRGDWQVAQWATPIVPCLAGKFRRNPLSMLSRWKIGDNLRRSLVPAALTLLLLLGWTVLPMAWFWTVAVVGIILIPSLIASTWHVVLKPADISLRQHLTAAAISTGLGLLQGLLTLACLPFEAFYSLDAIVRTLWRLLISHRGLLEWNPSSGSECCRQTTLADSCRAMGIAPILAATAVLVLGFLRPSSLWSATPILLLWLSSPVVAWWTGRSPAPRQARLLPEQTVFLHSMARKTWVFFETFVGPEDYWLPPDNFQEHPIAVVAHRTSPTNMGLSLLANLSACDFGYISPGKLIERTTNALCTMESLERYRGHFYNWYDTQSLKPLLPLYISSVDSGNLAGHLLVLRQGLLGLADEVILGKRFFEGLEDSLNIALETAALLPATEARIALLHQQLAAVIYAQPTDLAALRLHLATWAPAAEAAIKGAEAGNVESESSLAWWMQSFVRQCHDGLDELSLLAPWLENTSMHQGTAALPDLNRIPTLRQLAALADQILPSLESRLALGESAEETAWLEPIIAHIKEASCRADERIATLERLALQANKMAQMEYGFLFDTSRRLLAIGYNTGDHRQDASYYDLLASEARFASFVAIAQGGLPQETWFALGRLLTTTGCGSVLLSWSGSMFEYLMPLLVMPTYEDTLLDQTCRGAVASQIDYGRKSGTPWGVSECGYNAIDAHLNYQYRAFGVPGLGLKRGLAEDLVIAPYATALALMVDPEKACLNLERMADIGFMGRFGFYEAIDYTPSRLPRGVENVVVRSFMAHHQGMSLLSLAYLLLDRPMQKRFETEPLFQATLLLLQERIPKGTTLFTHSTELAASQETSTTVDTPMRVFNSPDTPNPEVQLLSNGRYHVMVTNAGGGYSRWQDLAVTRWREDSTCDNWGSFCYIRDVASGTFWSTTHQPVLRQSDAFETVFSEERAEFRCRHDEMDAYTEVVVSSEDDVEVRRITLTNRSRKRKTIDVTSYAEVVLAPPAGDALHPAFSNLFVQTEIIREQRAILCTRRPRSVNEQTPWMFHLMAVHGAEVGDISYETDRLRFIGRGNTVASPQAMSGNADFFTGALSNSEGSVLDPIVAIRYRIILQAEESVTINLVSGIGETRDDALRLVEKHQDRRLADRVFDLAWTHGQVLLRQFNASEADSQLYRRLAGSIIYNNPTLRAEPSLLIKNRRGQSGLWGYAISGDLPIVLLQIEDPANIELVRQLVQAHAYWRLKGLSVDLVIWNEDRAGYRQLLHDQIMGLIAAGVEANVIDRPGGIFVRPGDQIAEEDRILIQTVARAIISDKRGSLAEQIKGRNVLEATVPALIPTRTHRSDPLPVAPNPRLDLSFFNGLGGFTPDGREYVITTAQGQLTPAPWVNVLANPQFGTIISESGLAYTWAENAHEFRLTPWANDPVCDSTGEALYLRDEERGHFWSPTPLPCRGATPYATRHGFGYSIFEHTERGISSELTVYVALDAAVKFMVLKVRNESGRHRRLSATGYVEWVLGDLRPKSTMHVVTEIDPASGALLARNPYNTEFSNRTAFFAVDDTVRTMTGDRTEFLGRNGTLQAPAAMTRTHLSGRVGAALDPCGAIQVSFELAAGQEREIIFKLGVGHNLEEANNLVHRFRGPTAARTALDLVWQHWKHTLGAIQVETPDQSVNVLVNGWLLYQILSCRMWARSATYQSGGAFGFRDQLQDVMALIYARPHLVREHLLLAASHQFPEGDVQHWWHPPLDRGVRTRCSDDYLWLPLVVSCYVQTTGDTGILDEAVHFVLGRPVKADEDSYYDLPGQSEETASLYEHCVRAIVHGLTFGEHGLPLIGSGDWNDGMDLIGIQGKGESVWLGFFLYEVLERFSEIARARDDMEFAKNCTEEAMVLRRNIKEHGWDGQWYRRAYFDDGTPLGSSSNPECQIDSIAQSWSVLSGAGDPERSHQAMESLNERLVRRQDRLIQLLDPPFDTSELQPGYIKGYVPGVRENGGQYTHAAIWATMAFARLGDHLRAWELFDLINPIHHARSPEEIDIYKVEPYVVAADVYAVPPHIGRGGWTWYTGSAAWMYRLLVESLLGVKLEVNILRFIPCLPADWGEFTMHYRYRETLYHIRIMQTKTVSGAMQVTVDGLEQNDGAIHLIDDHQEHAVEVRTPVPTDKTEENLGK